MTKARDLANIISGGFTADDIPNLDASKIISGSLADARIPNLATSKITSGTFADARLSQSSVQQYASTFDDNKIVNDISTLALRQASNENKSAYNTNSMYVDVFQDSSAISNLTNVQRNSDEFVFAGAIGTPAEFDYDNASPKAKVKYTGTAANTGVYYEIDNNGDSSYSDTRKGIPSIAVSTGDYPIYTAGNLGESVHALFDFQSAKTFTSKLKIGKQNTWGDLSQYKISYSLDDTTYTNWDMSGVSQSALVGDSDWSAGSQGGAFVSGTSAGLINVTANGNTSATATSVLTLQNVPEISARYIKISPMALHSASNNNAAFGIFAPFVQTTTVNATGSFESNAITALSSTNKMGAIITYENAQGTNALNTDIVLQLSADNGSNFTTATLTAMPDFATGIKMAKVNDLSVTAGTQLKYKISFANQSSGSKEARIRGVSLQY